MSAAHARWIDILLEEAKRYFSGAVLYFPLEKESFEEEREIEIRFGEFILEKDLFLKKNLQKEEIYAGPSEKSFRVSLLKINNIFLSQK